jgi:hypothetical protein
MLKIKENIYGEKNMSRADILNKSEEEFKRYTGIPQWLFWEMTAVLIWARRDKLAKGGRKPKLRSWEIMLMTLEYWREYRTFFHISVNYGISESNCWKIIVWVEDLLIKSGKYNLPGKKVLLESPEDYEVIQTDATESPIERPKKTEFGTKSQSKTGKTNRNGGIQGRKSVIR